MNTIEDNKRPSKEEQEVALESYNSLLAAIDGIKTENPEIEIEETNERIKIPLKALKFLVKILKVIGQGKPISLMPIETEMTTQAAAEFIGCSRPHLVKLLENGEIKFTKVGKHRRVRFEDVVSYKKEMKRRQEALLIEMMKSDEDLGNYD